MEARITLRINSQLNEWIEKEKERTGQSKNRIILEACKKLIEDSKQMEAR